MKIHFLGTNGWFDTKTGDTTCILIDAKEAYIILDAGNGIYKIDKYIKNSKKPVYLFLSHFHLDHIIGLHALEKFRFKQGLHIYSQKGSKRLLNLIIAKPFSMPFAKLPFKTFLHEIGEGAFRKPLPFKTKYLLHASKCLGYRFKIEGKVITFCTDTGYCKGLLELARGADLLITECAYASGQVVKSWPHLNPESATQAAKEAGVKKLALVHFDAGIYDNFKKREFALKTATTIFKNTIKVKDGSQIVI